MGLHTKSLGESGSRVVLCHGLFGQGRNWTTIGRALAAEHHRVDLVDMPDHGFSSRSHHFDYLASADAVAGLLAQEPATVVGHSMGGKVAMLVALRHPGRVERLVVVDVAPVPYDHAVEFAGYLAAMRAIDLDTLADRGSAEDALAEAVPDAMIRGFLLQSLRREGSGAQEQWRWLLNLPLLARDLDAITGWPEESLHASRAYPGPVLWIGGQRSPYVQSAYVAAMDRWFPRNRRVTIKNAGHWVHSEQPAVFIEVLARFLEQ